MNRIFLFALLVASFSGCDRAGSQQAVSPDGKLRVRTEISDDVGEVTSRSCVILIFHGSKGQEKHYQTAVSDSMKWALDWHDTNTLVLFSSDVGTVAYDVEAMEITERIPCEEEIVTGREAYRKRYGGLPGP